MKNSVLINLCKVYDNIYDFIKSKIEELGVIQIENEIIDTINEIFNISFPVNFILKLDDMIHYNVGLYSINDDGSCYLGFDRQVSELKFYEIKLEINDDGETIVVFKGGESTNMSILAEFKVKIKDQ